MSEINVGAISEALNDKTDRDMRNVDTVAGGDAVIEYQAPTAENNYTWYRKYKSGWVEQGGITTNDEYTPVILLVPMQDTNYLLLGQCEGLATGNYNFVVKAKTTTSFTADASYGGGTKKASWQVSGMAA